MVAEAGVDAIDPVADQGVDVGEAAGQFDGAGVEGAEEVANEGPVGGGGGGSALMAGSVAIE